MLWSRRPRPSSVPRITCTYCATPYKWAMNMLGAEILVCADHVDKGLDEFLEIQKAKEVNQ